MGIDWASEFKHKGYPEITGKTNDFIFLLDTEAPTHENTFYKNEGNIQILKFDKNLEYLDAYKVKDVFGKYCKIVDIYLTEDKMQALILNEAKSQILEKYEIDPNDMSIISKEKIYSFKQKYEYAPFGYYTKSSRFFGAKNSITVFKSFTRNNTLISINNGNGSKYADQTFLVYNRASFYEKINEFNIEFDRKKLGYKSIVDYSIRDNGDMTLLVQQYNTKLPRPRKKGKITYKFKVLRKPANEASSEVSFDTDGTYVIDPHIKLDGDGSIYFTAFYQGEFSNAPKNFAGFYQTKIDRSNKIIYKKKTAFSETQQANRSMDNYYDLLFTSMVDDKLLVVSQNKPKSFRQPHKTEFENIYFDLFEISGDYNSTDVLYDNQKSSKAYFWDDQTLMIFGDVHHEEIDNLSSGFTKLRKKLSKENYIVASVYQPNKPLEHLKLNGPGKLYLHQNNISFIKDNFYFIGTDQKKLRLGKLVTK